MNRKDKIEQMYLNLISEYGLTLPAVNREQAKVIFNDLLSNSVYDLSLLYWALWNLGERDLIQNKGLLYYKNYQSEVKQIKQTAEQKNKIIDFILDTTVYEMLAELNFIAKHSMRAVNENDKTVIMDYTEIFKAYNTELKQLADESKKHYGENDITDYTALNDIKHNDILPYIENLTQEDIEQIENLYIKYYLIPQTKQTKQQMSAEREGIIKQLSDIRKFIDYKTIPKHDYITEDIAQ
jgi:uncharacterized membrane protein YciS (DUF1049 family)